MISVFLSDVDGCLTNGSYSMNEDGQLFKSFSSRDFHGLSILHNIGVQIVFLSVSNDEVINRQAERAAKYARVITGVRDKYSFILEEYVNKNGTDWSDIAYIGDDIFDIPLLEAVGSASCPKDAHPLVKQVISDSSNGYISSFNGGSGAVREFTDYVVACIQGTKNDQTRKPPSLIN